MREKHLMKNTMNSRVYNMAIRQNLHCPICPPNKGCNVNRDNSYKSWKNYRGKQWRE